MANGLIDVNAPCNLKLYQILDILQCLNISFQEYMSDKRKYILKYNKLQKLKSYNIDLYNFIIKENMQLTAIY